MNDFSSAAYWEQRYRTGGTSGAGSRGAMAAFKAALINAFIADNGVADVLDFGCGDGGLLSLLRLPAYIGVDVSDAALARCAARFPQHRFVAASALPADVQADLVLSIDVIFHVVEDAAFFRYMHELFDHARRYVLIHSSNFDGDWPSPHVRHRRFADYVLGARPEWRLLAHLPNPYPFDPGRPDETSFADFFVYGRGRVPCCIRMT